MSDVILYSKTIFCDIDGTLVKHMLPADSANPKSKMILLDGTIEKLLEWDRKGYKIILTTGRKECSRKQTENQLAECGITYDLLIMGLGRGERVVINDMKPDSDSPTAKGITLRRNAGIKDLNI